MTRLFLTLGRQGGRRVAQAQQAHLAHGQSRLHAQTVSQPSGTPGATPGRTYSSSALPTIPTCPSPTCSCASTPSFPDNLEIDRKTPLNGLMPAYAEQVLVCTGQGDWSSKIEADNSGDNLAADLKELFGRGGVYSDPFHNVSVINSSFPSSPTPAKGTPPGLQTNSVYLLPSFKYVPWIPRVSFDSVQALAEGFILPEKLHPEHEKALSPIHKDRLTRKEGYRAFLPGVRDVEDVLVLICGHRGRDARCGVLGPVLQKEFEEKLESRGGVVMRDAVRADGEKEGEEGLTAVEAPETKDKLTRGAGKESDTGAFGARVGLISHIGGHKYAGNVIMYIPPKAKTSDGENHPLAGLGVWYGRVEPKHVEGIVQETLLKGKLIEEFFRGAINTERDLIKL
ncbi:FMI1 protein [Zalerion maritima]|uniref:Altered inheritance of mitochondria protein 32 n=1 Tax=Zalerion maritima TaxID=339359 RepID=A0AAD5WVX2_9PEZI|nr:FMI1 protein [Zalerion maritima]